MLGFITGSLSHGFPRVLDYINMCSLFFHSIEKRKGVKLYLCVYEKYRLYCLLDSFILSKICASNYRSRAFPITLLDAICKCWKLELWFGTCGHSWPTVLLGNAPQVDSHVLACTEFMFNDFADDGETAAVCSAIQQEITRDILEKEVFLNKWP